MTEQIATPPKVGRAGSKVSKKNTNCKPKRPQEKIQRSSQQSEQNPSEEEKKYFLRLVAATTSDPGAPFAPDALRRLKKLRSTDCAEFERVRAQLKIAGCRMTALERTLNGGDESHVLIELARSGSRMFKTPHGQSFARVVVNGHKETMFLRGTAFRLWLNQKFHQHTGSAPRSDAMRGALETLEAQSSEKPIAVVHTRVAEKDGKLYLDLCDEKWRVVEVTALDWCIVQQPPVFFRRAQGMTALPVPEAGGSIELLRPFLNVASDSDFVLVVCWILACFRSSGPYPVLVLTGEHGSAKSSFTKNFRSLVDPNAVGLRSLPGDDRDLFIAASNGHVIAYDNVSDLPNWLSDTLCRLATGGGFATRQLFSDQDEVLIDAVRPIVLNGISEVVTRPDLSDRALFVHLPAIADDKRRPEAELNAEFEAVRPRILGALLDAVAHGLKRLPETHLEKSPRMADFARWATACEGALWPPGTFWAAYNANRSDAVENVIEANLVAVAVRDFMTMRTVRTVWTGTATDLLRELEDYMDFSKQPKDWPTTSTSLSNKLHRVETDLRKIGIEIEFQKVGRNRTRMITIHNKTGNTPSASSAPSAIIIKTASISQRSSSSNLSPTENPND